MAKLIAHLLATDAISWEVLSEIKLNENDTTSSGRIFIKILLQELAETLSLVKLYQRISDPYVFDDLQHNEAIFITFAELCKLLSKGFSLGML